MIGFLTLSPPPPVLSINDMVGHVVIPNATPNMNGLLSSSDKLYLDTLHPTLKIITSNLDATITVSKDNILYEGLNSSGNWTFNLPAIGLYNVIYSFNEVDTNYFLDVKYIGINEYKLNYNYLVTRADLAIGFKNVSPTYLTNQVDGSAGFTIVGSSTSTSGVKSSYLRWDDIRDLTYVQQIKFCARKNADHGNIGFYVSDGLTASSPVIYADMMLNYKSITGSSWAEYTIDVSDIVGEKTISYVGGYTDSSGNSSSSTSFCNIRYYY